MGLTKEKLYEGLSTSIKENSYLSSKEYVEPFINFFPSNTTFRIKAKVADQIIGDDVSKITYNRVCIEAEIQTDEDGYTEIVGLTYALDVKDPVWKLYRGHRNEKDNLIMSGDPFLFVNALEPETGFKNISIGITNLLALPTNLSALKKALDIEVERDTMSKRLGEWVQYCLVVNKDYDLYKVKLSERVATKAFKSLVLDQDSEWFHNEKLDNKSLLDAAINAVDDGKDILTHVEKSIMVKEMLSI